MFIESGCERLSGCATPERKEIECLKKELAERDQVIGEQKIATRVQKKLGRLTLTVEFKADVMDARSQTAKRAILLMLNPRAFIECIMHTSFRFFIFSGASFDSQSNTSKPLSISDSSIS